MVWCPPEIETEADDALRMEKCMVTWLGNMAERLQKVKLHKTHERLFVERMLTRLTVLKLLPEDHDVEKLKAMAWKYRREMPAYARPKLPPHDPIVREMERNGG